MSRLSLFQWASWYFLNIGFRRKKVESTPKQKEHHLLLTSIFWGKKQVVVFWVVHPDFEVFRGKLSFCWGGRTGTCGTFELPRSTESILKILTAKVTPKGSQRWLSRGISPKMPGKFKFSTYCVQIRCIEYHRVYIYNIYIFIFIFHLIVFSCTECYIPNSCRTLQVGTEMERRIPCSPIFWHPKKSHPRLLRISGWKWIRKVFEHMWIFQICTCMLQLSSFILAKKSESFI